MRTTRCAPGTYSKTLTFTLSTTTRSASGGAGRDARRPLKRSPAMRITGVHTAVVEANYDWTFVRIDAEGEGLTGIGECFCAPG